MSLILHELATNAVKHGALSAPKGKIQIHWSLDAEDKGPRLHLLWQEIDGPRATPPDATGFGTRLIQVAAAELGGRPELAYEPSGLKAEIIFPLSSEA